MKITPTCLALAALLGGCGAPRPEQTPADAAIEDVTSNDAGLGGDARAKGQNADATRRGDVDDAGTEPDAPSTDIPLVDIPAADVPLVDIPAADVPAARSLGGRCSHWSLCSTSTPVPACAEGLACAGEVCVPGLRVGARCVEGGAPCGVLSSCVTRDGVGTCVADGDPGGRCFYHALYSCDLGGTSDYSCGRGTVCSASGRCEPPAPLAPCASSATCGAGFECLLWEGARVCVPDRGEGSRCRPSTIGTPTLVCPFPFTCARRVAEGVEDRCVMGIADDAPCTPDDLAHPCSSRNCAFDGSGYRCATGPRALGATCSLNEHCGSTPADVCNGDNRCARWVALGETCERRADNLLCDTDVGCVARDATLPTGVCTAAVPEREPNAATSPQPLAANTAVRGELLVSAADVDCYRVSLPRAATLLAEVRQPGTLRCVEFVRVQVTNALGTLVAESAGDGLNGRCAPPLVRPLDAGDYTLCVRPESRDARYVLTVGVR